MTAREIFESKLTSAGLSLSSGEITMALEEVNQVVLNYINREAVPQELNYVVANMCMDLARYEHSLKATEVDDINLGDVDSIKIGDTNIKLGGKGSVESKAHTLDMDSVLMNYSAQLNKFRRMVWL